MAQQDIVLPDTEHEEQHREYLCGAASVNMILSHWDKQQPQGDIWSAIQAHTGVQARPVPCDPNDEGCFATQFCDRCSDGSFKCWYSTPEALASTVNDYSPTLAAAEYHTDPDNAIRRVAECLTGPDQMPAAFTKAANLHWSVAVGYQIDGPDPTGSGITWSGSGKITAIYVRDPNGGDAGQDVMQLTTLANMKKPIHGYLEAIVCGVHTNAYPIVVRSKDFTKSTFRRLVETTAIYIYKPIAPWMQRVWIPKKKLRPLPPPPL